MLKARQEAGKPIRVVLIGAGKFGAMFLAQALHTPGLHVMAVADLSPDKARRSLVAAGWPAERFAAASPAKALDRGSTFLTDDAIAAIGAGGVDVVVEATGVPEAGIGHALACFKRGRHVVMVNVEADALAGPLLAHLAAEAGVVYSLAYGDQPALICEQVEWAGSCGFKVVCAGKGTKYLPEFHASNPDTVWDHYGITAEQAEAAGMNSRMFNSFVDGTKSALEMASVANATGLMPQAQGLGFPPAGVGRLAEVCRPRQDGGALDHKGTLEVVSSLERDGSPVEGDLRWGVYVTFEAPSDYGTRCFAEYGIVTDDSGRYASLYRPFHFIGLELGLSVAHAGLLGRATGAPVGFSADAVAHAKRGLETGEVLDGEGGYCVYGKLMAAADSLEMGGVPIGLVEGAKLKHHVATGHPILWSNVEMDETKEAVVFRRRMEAALTRE